MTPDVILVGAGIGGLSAALTIARRGLGVRVLERAAGPRTVGAGIGLAPNACALLDRMGLHGALSRRGSRLRTMTVCTNRGRALSAAPLSYDICGTAYQPIGIHRADLLDELLQRAQATGRVEVTWSAGVEHFDMDARGVRAHCEDGRVYDGRLLVGADGIHSRVRAQLHGDVPPRYAGYTCWRGVAHGDFVLGGAAMEAWGSGRRFGFLPIGGSRVYWFAVENGPPNTRLVGKPAQSYLLASFGESFAIPAVGELIAATLRTPFCTTISSTARPCRSGAVSG